MEDDVPEHPIAIPFGKGRIVRQGTDVTIVAASLMAYEAKRAADILSEQGISAEVIDPRSIRPLDEEIILESIAKTRHLVVADTSWATYGFAAEVAAVAAEKGFADLQAPVKRVTLPDCPAPVSKSLEDIYHPTPRTIAQACLDVLRNDVQVTSHHRDVQEAFAGPY
jgi:pyruvate/2-oxoglutarate/acetoin dehydrogenase E1 component